MISHFEDFPSASADQEKPPVAKLSADAPSTITRVEGADAAGGLTCRVLADAQGSNEWKDARRRIFTASEITMSLVEEPECRLTVAQLKEVLDDLGIPYASKATKPDLVALVPDIAPYLSPTETAKKSRASLIRRKAGLQTEEGIARDKHANEKLERNFDIQRGKELEPRIRKLYGSKQKCSVTEVGLCIHKDSIVDMLGVPLDGFGCSPDGLIAGDDDLWVRGLEIKAPSPEKILEWIDGGVLPEEHAAQVQMSMAVTGLREWDFAAFCPGLPLFLVRVYWSETTDRMLAELKKLHADYVAYRSKLDPKRIVRIGFKVEEVAA